MDLALTSRGLPWPFTRPVVSDDNRVLKGIQAYVDRRMDIYWRNDGGGPNIEGMTRLNELVDPFLFREMVRFHKGITPYRRSDVRSPTYRVLLTRSRL